MAAPKNLILNPKQIRFCEEYIVDYNGTQAAIRAGYSAHSANVIASALLTKPNIEAHIDELKVKQSKRTEVTADRIIKEIARLAFFNKQDVMDEFGETLPLEEWSRDDLAAIQEITTTTTGLGKYKETTTKIKMSDKKGNLELLGRHKKLFTDKVEMSGDVTFNLSYGDTKK